LNLRKINTNYWKLSFEYIFVNYLLWLLLFWVMNKVLKFFKVNSFCNKEKGLGKDKDSGYISKEYDT